MLVVMERDRRGRWSKEDLPEFTVLKVETGKLTDDAPVADESDGVFGAVVEPSNEVVHTIVEGVVGLSREQVLSRWPPFFNLL